MSQFILFMVPDNLISKLKKYDFLLIEDAFLLSAASFFYKKEKEMIYTINNFDGICMNSQYSLANGIKFKETNLNKCIQPLCKNDIEFFMWYGDSFDVLDEIETEYKLLETLHENLCEGSGEIYVHYKPQNIHFSNFNHD